MTTVDRPLLPLTDRHLTVLDLLSRGRRQQEIADVLGLSLDTIKTHTGRLYRRLRVRNAAEAVRVGFEHGLLPRAVPVDVVDEEA